MEPMTRTSQAKVSPIFLQDQVLKQVLKPYVRTQTDYLKSGHVVSVSGDVDTLFKMHGEFKIPVSCYIDSTGHFNAVEYIICYNQLAYFAFGELISTGLLKTLPINSTNEKVAILINELTYEAYLKKQLESMYILKSETKFKAPIEPGLFYADLSIRKILYRKGTFFIKTDCRFYDDIRGEADGEITLAYRAEGFQ